VCRGDGNDRADLKVGPYLHPAWAADDTGDRDEETVLKLYECLLDTVSGTRISGPACLGRFSPQSIVITTLPL
jgi:hypothetical protein